MLFHISTMFTKKEKKNQKEKETTTTMVRFLDEACKDYGKIL
jgi:hypothetical protein